MHGEARVRVRCLPPWFLHLVILKQDLSLNLELANSAQLDGQQTQSSSCVFPPALGLQSCATIDDFLCLCWLSELRSSCLHTMSPVPCDPSFQSRYCARSLKNMLHLYNQWEGKQAWRLRKQRRYFQTLPVVAALSSIFSVSFGKTVCRMLHTQPSYSYHLCEVTGETFACSR